MRRRGGAGGAAVGGGQDLRRPRRRLARRGPPRPACRRSRGPCCRETRRPRLRWRSDRAASPCPALADGPRCRRPCGRSCSRGAPAGLEAAEVVRSQQRLGGAVHRRRVEPAAIVPAVLRGERRRGPGRRGSRSDSACRRRRGSAWKPSGTSATSSTAMSSRQVRRSGPAAARPAADACSVWKPTTWPRAWTPASVRPLASVADRLAGDLARSPLRASPARSACPAGPASRRRPCRRRRASA